MSPHHRVLFLILLALSSSANAFPQRNTGLLSSGRLPFKPIDLPHYLKEAKYAATKIINDANNDANQHLANMKKKHIDLIHQHLHQALTPMNIKDRLDSIKQNLKMDFSPIKNPLNSHHSAHSTFPHPKPCLGSIVNCLYVPVTFHHNILVGPSLIKPPCHGHKCGLASILKPIRKPTLFVTLKPSYPGYSETFKPPVYHYNTHSSICNSKNISPNSYLYFKCNHKNSLLPTYATVKSLTVANSVTTSAPIKNNLYPLISSTTHPEKFNTESIKEQIFLPQEIYNLATDPPTVSQETHKPYGMEALKENITHLEKEILGITDNELPLIREVTDFVFPTTDKIMHKEDLVTEHPKSTSRQVLYLNTSKNNHDKSQQPKSLVTTEISLQSTTNSEEILIRSIQPTETQKTTTKNLPLLDKGELSKTIQSFQTDFESMTTMNPLFSITSSIQGVKDLGSINKSWSEEASGDYTTSKSIEGRLIETTDSDSSKDTEFILNNTFYLDPSVPTVSPDFKHDAGNSLQDNYNTTEMEQSSSSFFSDLRENFRLGTDDNFVLDSDNVQHYSDQITPVMSNREHELNSDAITLTYENEQTTEISKHNFSEQQIQTDEKYYESTPLVLLRTDDHKVETQLATENTKQSPDYEFHQELKTEENYYVSTPLVLPTTEANNEEMPLTKHDIQDSSVNELEQELEMENKYYGSTQLVLSRTEDSDIATQIPREDVHELSDNELENELHTEQNFYESTPLVLSNTDDNEEDTRLANENIQESSINVLGQLLQTDENYYETTPLVLSRTEETQLAREDIHDSLFNKLEQGLEMKVNYYESTPLVSSGTDSNEEGLQLHKQNNNESSHNDLDQELQTKETYYQSTPWVLSRTEDIEKEVLLVREDDQKSSDYESDQELKTEENYYETTPLVLSRTEETQLAREDIQDSSLNELEQELEMDETHYESTPLVLPGTDKIKEEPELLKLNHNELPENYFEQELQKEEKYYDSTPLDLSTIEDNGKETQIAREYVQESSDTELEHDLHTEQNMYESTPPVLSRTDDNEEDTHLGNENIQESSINGIEQELQKEEKYYETTPLDLSTIEYNGKETQIAREYVQESSDTELEHDLHTEQNMYESTPPVLSRTDDNEENTHVANENIRESSITELGQVIQTDENYYETTPLVLSRTEETQLAREDIQDSLVNELEQELEMDETHYESTPLVLPRIDKIKEDPQLLKLNHNELPENYLEQELQKEEKYYDSTPLDLSTIEDNGKETQIAREYVQESSNTELEHELHTEQNMYESTPSVLSRTDDNEEDTHLANENIQESSINGIEQELQKEEKYYDSTPLELSKIEDTDKETQVAREDVQESSDYDLELEIHTEDKWNESTPLVLSRTDNLEDKTQTIREHIQESSDNELETEQNYYERTPSDVSNTNNIREETHFVVENIYESSDMPEQDYSTQSQSDLRTITVSTTPTNVQDLNLEQNIEDIVISTTHESTEILSPRNILSTESAVSVTSLSAEGREIISQSGIAEETSEKHNEIDLVIENEVDISSKTGNKNNEVLINNRNNNLEDVTKSSENWFSTEFTTYGNDQSAYESSTSYFIHTSKSNDSGVRFGSEVESSTGDHTILLVNEEVPYDTDDEIDPTTEQTHFDDRVKRSLVINETISASVTNREKVLNFTLEMSGKLKNSLKGVKGYNQERSSQVSHASVILELLPLIREGYKNNAFNEHDKKAIASIFGDIKSLKDGKPLPVVTDFSEDMFMGDETSRLDDMSDYSDDEYEQEQDRLKRFKDVEMVSDHIRKLPSRVKRTISSSLLQQNVRNIRSARPQKVSEAAAILALLAEDGGAVQLDSPDDYDDDDSYEYYEDEEEDLYSDDKDDDDDDDDQFYDDYGDASFTELIRLAKKHRERKAKEQ